MREAAGIQFGSYALLKRLARGGMAEVFLGRQQGLQGFDRLVAVKRVLPHLADSPEFIQMFFDEARLAAKISHPNCVHIYEFGKVGDDYFIAMEYVHGVHAGQLIAHASIESISPVLVARLGADACLGLHYAHELRDDAGRPLDIVHRDVSPPNLLISYDGTTKLVDFGIAKAAISVEQTRPGVVKGKYAYMSPEQTVGRKLGSKSDVFSLGMVMWELLAGQVAVTRDDKVEAMKVIRDGKVPPIESVRTGIPPALGRALSMALHVDPEQRFSAHALRVALEEYIKTEAELGSSFELGQWVTQRFPPESPTGDGELDQLLTRSNERISHHPAAMLSGVASGFLEAMTIPTPLPALADMEEATQISLGPPSVDLSALPEARRRPEIPAGITAMAASVQLTPVRPDPHARFKTIGLAAGAAIVLGVLVLVFVSSDESRTITAEHAAVVPIEPAPERAAAQPPAVPPGRDASPGIVERVEPADSPSSSTIEVLVTPPGAQVSLSGRKPVKAPAVFDELVPADYRVAVSLAGFVPIERTIHIAVGEHRTLELSMIPTADTSAEKTRPKDTGPGQLIVRTVPYSVAYLNGKKLDTTPFTRELRAGRYTLTFRHPDHPPEQRTVTIRPGRKTKLSFRLK